MKLMSVNVSLPREVEYQDTRITTGIFKQPVSGRVAVRGHNVAGDGQADLDDHGGDAKAVYTYPHEHYATWAAELERDDLTPGQFGENFTIEGLTEQSARIGDVLEIGTAAVQIAQPRVPCFKLGIRMGNARFPRMFLRSGRLGYYLRIVRNGEVGAGDAVRIAERRERSLSIHQMWQLVYASETADLSLIDVALQFEWLADEWRRPLERLAAGGE